MPTHRYYSCFLISCVVTLYRSGIDQFVQIHFSNYITYSGKVHYNAVIELFSYLAALACVCVCVFPDVVVILASNGMTISSDLIGRLTVKPPDF